MRPALVHALTFLLWLGWYAGAWGEEAGARLIGFTDVHAGTQVALEQKFDAQLKASDQQAWLEQMASAPNHVGSPHDRTNADFMLAQFKQHLPMMPAKAYRWIAEMREIAGFVGDDPAARELYDGAAHFFERIAEDFVADQKAVAALKAFLAKDSS